MTTAEHAPSPTPTRSSPALVATMTGHALRSFIRTPMSAFFTLIFPLAFLVVVSAIVGNEMTEAGVPVAQFLVAPFAVFGAAEAAFVVLATDTAVLRESGVLMRLRGTPVPAWTVLAGRIGAALVVAGAAVVLLTSVGAGVYGVEIVWRKVPALLLTLALGIACFAALGLALVSLTRTSLAVQTLSQGLLIPLAFISDVFIVGADLPVWLARIGSALPLKHFARAMAETFDPHGGYGFSPGGLAVIAAWGVAGALIAGRRFGWAPRGAASRAVARPAPPGRTPTRAQTLAPLTARRAPGSILRGQIRYALTVQRRDALSVFFAVVFPVLLLVLFPAVFPDALIHGLKPAEYLLPGLAAYAIAVAGYVNMPEAVAQARGRGVLKRLRGTPLPWSSYLAGRMCSVLVVSALSTVLLVTVSVLFLRVRVDPVRLPALAIGVVLGVLCFTALGLAVLALLRSATSLIAVTLGTLLPLSFISDVFPVGDAPLPDWLSAIADLFPLRHLAQALLAATGPAGHGAGLAYGHLAIVAAWAVGGLVAVRLVPLHRA